MKFSSQFYSFIQTIMKASKWIYGLLVLAIVVAALTVANPKFFEGKLIYSSKEVARPVVPPGKLTFVPACITQWTKIFEGSFDTDNEVISAPRWFALDTVIAVSHGELERMIREGCDFKVVRESASGGGFGKESFYCTEASTGRTPDDVEFRLRNFSCVIPPISSTGVPADVYTESTALVFEFEEDQVYYAPNRNQPDPAGPFILSIFVKK